MMLSDAAREYVSPEQLQEFFSPTEAAAFEIEHGRKLNARSYAFPVVLFGSAYWEGLLKWMKEVLLKEGKIVESDLKLLYLTDSPAEAVEIVVKSQDSLRKLDKTISDIY